MEMKSDSYIIPLFIILMAIFDYIFAKPISWLLQENILKDHDEYQAQFVIRAFAFALAIVGIIWFLIALF